MSDLYTPDGQLVNGSASQRRIASLMTQVAMLENQVEHLRAMLAVLAYQAGGTAIIPIEDLKASYQLEATPSEDETTIVWTVTKTPGELAGKS